jgi:hypothetical protein
LSWSFTAKRRLVYGALVFLTIWPLAHMVLAYAYGLSSWKLCGWGMYATPRPKTYGMDVYGRRPGASGLEQLANPTPALAESATTYLERFRWMGRLASPEPFARLVLAEHPEWELVQLQIFHSHLELASGMVVMRREDYEFAR